jgi:diguanylate cyclase (GGDEF)-like protein
MVHNDIFNSPTQDVRARLQLLYGNLVGGTATTLICMAILCFAFENPESQTIKTIIFIALLCSQIGRLIDNFYTKKELDKPDFDVQAAKKRFTIGVVSNALIWASFSFLTVPYMQNIEGTITTVILSALAGGSIAVLAATRSLAILYMSCLLLPFSLMIYVSGLSHLSFMAYLGPCFWAVMIFSTSQVSQFITNTLAHKNKNIALLNLTDIEKKEVERVNQELLKANEQLDNYTHMLESEVEKRTSEIYRLSNLDPLTGIMNRSAFLQSFKKTLYRSSDRYARYALLFIDLDGFKDVNDGFGHKVGDAVLGEIALRLKELEVVMDLDDKVESLLCRWGGDEFLVCTELVSEAFLSSLIQDIISSITTPISVSSNNITLGASIGVSRYPEDSTEPNELIQYADISMYYQKKHAKGIATHFSPALFDEFQHEQVIRDGLKSALENNELSLMFQPIVDIDKHEPWAIEALLRWEHKGQKISPAEFIPIAEKSGRIVEIGAWVLQQACNAAAQWTFANKPSVSVNVSSLQLLDNQFINIIDEVLESSSLPADRLHLEITESVMLENGELAKSQLKAIADRGIHVSIDDFGTGFSSLNQLQTMSFDIIKIDRSFLQGLNKKDLTIISATKLIADEFVAKTVAEGIETETELAVLKGLGIRYIQGYLFARPMQSDDLDEWIKTF